MRPVCLLCPSTFPTRGDGFLRFSLRGLIVVVLLIGAWLGWIVRECESSARPSPRYEGNAQTSSTTGSGRMVASRGRRVPWVPRWLADAIGVDYFGNLSGSGRPRLRTMMHCVRLDSSANYENSAKRTHRA